MPDSSGAETSLETGVPAPHGVSYGAQAPGAHTVADAPTRDEVSARLEAAEARTEARMAELRSVMREMAVSSNHRFEILTGKMDALATAVQQVRADTQASVSDLKADSRTSLAQIRSENQASLAQIKTENHAALLQFQASNLQAVAEFRADNKQTRAAIWTVGLGSVVAVLALVVALWVAGINEQANLINVFQASLGVISLARGRDAAPPQPAFAKPQK